MLKTVKLKKQKSPLYNIKQINNIYFTILNQGKHTYTLHKYFTILKHFFTHTFVSYVLRIVWRGKAYRVRLFKRNCKFTLNFGHSHWYKLWYNYQYYTFCRIRRQSYLVFFSHRKDFFEISTIFNKIRVYNKYTRRGIRLKKSFYIRRFGKISQVNSILHSF